MRALPLLFVGLLLAAACGNLAFEPFGTGGDPGADAGPTPDAGPDAGSPGPCGNDRRDEGETDLDCGGVCGATCAEGQQCARAADCASDTCIDGTCRPVEQCLPPPETAEICRAADRACGRFVTVDRCGRERDIASCGKCSEGHACNEATGACTCSWVTAVLDQSGETEQSAALAAAPDGTLHAVAWRKDKKSLFHTWSDGGSWQTEVVQVADATWRAGHEWLPGATLVAPESTPQGDTLVLSAPALDTLTQQVRLWKVAFDPATSGWAPPKTYGQNLLQAKSGPLNASAARGGDWWVAYPVNDPTLSPAERIRVQYGANDLSVATPYDVALGGRPTALALAFTTPQRFHLLWAGADGKLHAASNGSNDTQVPATESVPDATGDVGAAVGAGVDGSGAVSAVYYDVRGKDLRHVRRQSGLGWEDSSLVDSEGDVGSALSFAVEPDGDAHVVYLDRTRNRLKYASRKSGEPGWSLETVDESGSPGHSPALVVGGDALHVVYFDTAGRTLKYARRCR